MTNSGKHGTRRKPELTPATRDDQDSEVKWWEGCLVWFIVTLIIKILYVLLRGV
jgi:hypothetical protein